MAFKHGTPTVVAVSNVHRTGLYGACCCVRLIMSGFTEKSLSTLGRYDLTLKQSRARPRLALALWAHWKQGNDPRGRARTSKAVRTKVLSRVERVIRVWFN